ncbi:MAG: hypothetical protein GY725_01075 [bacterium]|nr:hypothetical protein [bacterium]
MARFLFSDFPLGNPCGVPYDREMQQSMVAHALDLLESARLPRTTVQAPVRFGSDEDWKARYARIDASNREQLRAMGDRRRARQGQAKSEGRARES